MDLFQHYEATRFIEQAFERHVVHGRSSLEVDLDTAGVMELLPAALEHGGVRAVHAGIGPEGLTREALLDRLGGRVDPESFLRLFDQGELSFAVQGLEASVPALGRVCAMLAGTFGYRFDATVFLSPGKTVATRPHYDRSEVFALQLQGAKRWRIFAAADNLPAHRSRLKPVSIEGQVPLGDYRLAAGDLLYVPRGVVHHVENEGSAPSLHVSFVGLVDSWSSVVGNAMEAAYADLMDSEAWRASVRWGQSHSHHATEARDRVDELSRRMLERLEGSATAYFDHCVNSPSQRQAIERAGASIELLDADATDIGMVWSGAHFLRRVGDAGHACVSTDGERFYPVEGALLDALSAGPTSLDALGVAASCDDEELVRSLMVLVRDTGIAALVRLPGVDG